MSNIVHATYSLPIKLPRNQYGVTTNTSFISSSNDLFSNTVDPSSTTGSGSGSGGGSTYIPDFIGCTDEFDGVRGLVPAPQAGDNNKWLKGSGGWEEIPIMTPASELGFGGKEGLAPAPPVGSYDLYLTGGGNWTRPSVFRPATAFEAGLQGEVPAPPMGIGDYYLLESTGNWVFNAAQKWLYEWPDDIGLEPSGLGIDGDFNVSDTLSTFNLEVEGRAHFWELVIDRVKANGGQLLVSPSNFKVDDIGPTILYYIDEEPLVSILNYRPDIKRALGPVEAGGCGAIGIKCQRVFMRNDDGENSIVPSVAIGDMLRCRSFNIGPGQYEGVSNKDYWTFVLGVGSEQYRDIPEGYDQSFGTANFVDLAISILRTEDALPIDTVIEEDGTVVVPPDYDPTYEIADLKDISEQVRTGNHDRMEEFPTQYEMDQITVAVLSLPDIPIPDTLINVDDYIFHYEPHVDHKEVSGDVPWDSEDWASELDKYNNDPTYANWTFGYGKIEISIGDELACLGHLFDRDRRNAIILSANTPIDPELKAPAMAQYTGIDIFGLSISKFRLTTIAKNGNKFYGWFGVESGTEPGSYFSITDVISSSVQSAIDASYSYTMQSYNMLYAYVADAYSYSLSYIKQTADSINSYVIDSYAYTLSFINQRADGITSYVADSYAYTLSFINQRADSISSYVIDAYAYSLSFIEQTAGGITSYVGNVYDGLYSYITQRADGLHTEVVDTYNALYSYTTQTATSIKSYVGNVYDGLASYIEQTATGISSYVVNSYAYTLSYITQTANSITSYVTDSYSYTNSIIEQLSDEINLAVTKDDLEVVGIHLDGDNSTVNIVGSLAVHQNYDDETDTVKVYDEDEVLRVEITPEEIPAKSELSINDVTVSLTNNNWSNIRKDYNTRDRTIQYITYWNISSTVHTGDILTLINPSLSLSLVPEENTSFGATPFISWWDCWFKVETTTGESIISTGLVGSGVPSDYLQNYKTVTFKKNGNFSSGALSNNFDGKNLKITFYANFTFTSNAPSVSSSWNLASFSSAGSLNYKPYSGVGDTTFMQIGSNGFYYSYSGNYYLYSGEDGFEVNNNGNKISVTDDDVKICRTAYFTNESVLVIGESDPESDSSILVTTAVNYIDAGVAQTIILYDTALYGLGRELLIIGYQRLIIKTYKDPIWIKSTMTSNGRVDEKVIYHPYDSVPNLPRRRDIPSDFRDLYESITGHTIDDYEKNALDGTLILNSTELDYTNQYNVYAAKSYGTIRLIALSDGWHCIS